MKHYLIISILVFVTIFGKAQSDFSLTEGVSVVTYSLPKTELCFDIEIETITEKPGVFYLYSQRYLAVNKVIMEEKSTLKIKNIKMTSNTIPDLKRRYAVEVLPKSVLNGIVVDSQGILCGVNVEPKPVVQCDRNNDTNNNVTIGDQSSDILPLTQEYMMAGSVAKMAEGAAIQIYNIRSSRLNLLSGDVDHMPDGDAMKMMLSGLDKKEKELTELFVGSIRKSTTKHKIYFTPENPVSKEILFRLSAIRGVVDKDDLSGEPYFITVTPEKFQKQEPDPKTKLEKAVLFTVLPASTNITISDGVKDILKNNLQLPQLGELMMLPESLFKVPGLSISVDNQTGRLLEIKK
ncbi:DUF4831 family protein [Paludibacter sp.]